MYDFFEVIYFSVAAFFSFVTTFFSSIISAIGDMDPRWLWLVAVVAFAAYPWKPVGRKQPKH